MRPLRSQRGQGTVEYVAVIAVVALLIAAAVAKAAGVGAPSVVNAVAAQLQRGLCIVTGSDCEIAPPSPCALATRREGHTAALSIVFVRLSKDRYLLRERMSDGTVRLTVAKRFGGGPQVGAGFELRLARGPKLAVDAGASLEGLIGWGRTYVVRAGREARDVQRAIHDDADLPPPREVFYEGGARALAAAGITLAIADLSADAGLDAVAGLRIDRVTGERTVALNFGSSSTALARALRIGPAGTVRKGAVIGLTVDRSGRSAALSLTGTGTWEAGDARAVEQGLGGGRLDFTARVGLDDPLVATAWKRFRAHPTDGAAIEGLAAQLRDRARLDVREYDTSSSTHAVAGHLMKVGAESSDTTELARLRRAVTRPPGGLWELRLDC